MQRDFMYKLASKLIEKLKSEDKIIITPLSDDFCFKVKDGIMNYYGGVSF